MKSLDLKTIQRYAGKIRFVYSLFFILMLAFTSCDGIEDIDPNAEKGEVIYVGSNDFRDNQNSIIAYRNNGNGILTQIAGSPFLTGGKGLGNPMQILGPQDNDTPLYITSNGDYLLAVNSGSNTIAIMQIEESGALTPVAGSPFPSGGQTPVSIDISGQYVYVANKSQDPLNPSVNTQNPSYNTFTLSANGTLTPVSGGKVEVTPGSSPTQVLVSYDQKFAFGDDFLGFMLTPPVGTLRSFTVNTSGTLTPVGTPQAIPGMGGALGLWQHPKDSALYVGFPMQAKIGIYGINSMTGALTFKSTIDAGAAACWIRTTENGRRLYVLNSAENTVGAYNSTNAFSPTTIGKLTLKNSGPNYPGPMGEPFTTSQPFHLSFSSNESYLYVLNQHTNPDFNVGNFNFLHVLRIGSNGSLSEPGEPIQVPVPNTVRPHGVAVLSSTNLSNN